MIIEELNKDLNFGHFGEAYIDLLAVAVGYLCWFGLSYSSFQPFDCQGRFPSDDVISGTIIADRMSMQC